MKRVHYVLTVHCLMGVLACQSAFGQFYTSSDVSGDAFAGKYSQSNSGYATGSTTGDYASGFSQWASQGNANSGFGLNGLYVQTKYSYAVGYGNPAYGNNPSAMASYSLVWSANGGSQSGTIISAALGLGATINSPYVGTFSFVYGTPYSIQSKLTVNSSFPNSASDANSMWDDTFTFQGQPNGTVGNATFTVLLNGSLSEQNGQSKGMTPAGFVNFDDIMLTANFNDGAMLSSLSLPANSSIMCASGTIYPTPEPSTLTFLCMSLVGLGLRWFKRKLLPAANRVA